MDNTVYREKRKFVENIKPALTMLPGIEDVEYHFFSDKYSEFVRIKWTRIHRCNRRQLGSNTAGADQADYRYRNSNWTYQERYT